MIGRVLVHHRQISTERVFLLVGSRRDVELGDAVLSGQFGALGKRDVEELRHILRVHRSLEGQLVVLASLEEDIGRHQQVGCYHVVVLIRNVRARTIERPVLAIGPTVAVAIEVVALPEAELVLVSKADGGGDGECRTHHHGCRRSLVAVVATCMSHDVVAIVTDGRHGLVGEFRCGDTLSHLHIVGLTGQVVGQVGCVNPRLILTLRRSRPRNLGIGPVGRCRCIGHRHRVAGTYIDRDAGTVALSGTVEA